MKHRLTAAPLPSTYQMICRNQLWRYHVAAAADSLTIVALNTKIAPSSIRPHKAATWSLSTRPFGSLRCASNMLIGLGHGFAFFRVRPFALEQGGVNWLGHGRAGGTSGLTIFDHHHDCPTRVLVRRERSEPGRLACVGTAFVLDLRRTVLAANP